MTARANSLTERATTQVAAGVPPTVSGNDLAVLLDCLQRLGYDTRTMLAGTPLADVDFSDPDARIRCEAYGTIIERAQASQRMANLALEVARLTPIGAYPLVDYLVITSETVAEGIRQLARYFKLTSSPVAIAVHDTLDPIRIEMTCGVPFAVEHLAVLTVLHLRRETEGQFAAHTVSFQHEPDEVAAFERVLECPVQSSASWNGVSVSPDAWRLPLRRRDSALRPMLEKQANAMIARLPSRSGFAFDVQRVLAARIAGGDTSMRSVARQLGMSGRTMQRRLATEGVSYQELVDAARKEAAGRYLDESTLAIGEVAYLVGYSEPAPFHRAFRRWYGMTPDAFRRKALKP